MEVSKFWTKTKIIVLLSILVIIGIVVGSIFLYRNSLKKKYISLESKFNNSINNYLKAVGLEIEDDNYIETNIKDIINKGGFVTDENAKDCEGYVISVKDGNTTYLKCKNIYTTEGYGSKVVGKTKSNQVSQTEKDTKKPVIVEELPVYLLCSNCFHFFSYKKSTVLGCLLDLFFTPHQVRIEPFPL